MAMILAVFYSSLGHAISMKISPFNPVSPEETAHWVHLLGLGAHDTVRVKSITVWLRDVSLSATRVESAACVEDACPTFFKYELGKVFEFVISCKEEVEIQDITTMDPSGKYVVSIALATGHNLTTLIKPTSLGPIITTLRETIRP
jgi:hypothetical protein